MVSAIDSNILIYAHRNDSPFHVAANKLVSSLVNGNQPWAIPWPCIHEFIGIVTNPRIYKPCSTIDQAFHFVDKLRDSNSVTLIGEGPGYYEKMKVMAVNAKLKGAKIHDCKIAAICENHGIKIIYTADRDFSLFPALRTINPLV